MADHNERWVLNHLIEMCRDEERTLRFAAEHVTSQAVRALFGELASRRAEFAAQLVPHAERLGGADASEGTARGALHRRWVALKDTLLGHNEMTLIQDAESIERDTLLSFENALRDLLPPTSRDLIEQQCDELRKSHERVRSLLMH
ncbi:MAG TPA: PA2169 family four-helix-bundle protein [Vicinamibacterales bacterium]